MDPDHKPGQSWVAAVIVFAGLLAPVLVVWGYNVAVGDTLQLEEGPAYWEQQAEQLAASGDSADAVEACHAGLTASLWHPGLSRTLTRILLEGSDEDGLLMWIDTLVLGDPRLAEKIFEMPELKERAQASAQLAKLHREAVYQARD